MKNLSPSDLSRFSCLSWPQLSPSGRLAALVIRRPDEQGVWQPSVRVLDTDSGDVLYETAPGFREMQPRFLLSGGWALLSDASGEFQVWRIEDGNRRQLTTLRHGVSHYDVIGNTLAFEATLWPEEVENGSAFAEMTPAERRAFQEDLDLRPFVAEDLTYKLDEWYGLRRGEMQRIGVVVDGQSRLLPRALEGVYPALSPEADGVAFLAYPFSGAQGRRPALMIWDLASDEIRMLSEKDASLSDDQAPLFTADGRRVMVPASHSFDDGFSSVLACFDPLGRDPVSFLPSLENEEACTGVNEAVAGPTEQGENRSCFALRGDRLLFLSGFHGRSCLFSAPMDGSAPAEPMGLPFEEISAFAVSESGDLAVLAGTASAPSDLYVNGRRLTEEHAWLAAFKPLVTKEFHVSSRDGAADLQYFLSFPSDYQPGRPYPAVLYIKGGPETVYTSAYSHEFHALTAAGFFVIHGNPRGSAGFSRSFRSPGLCWRDEPMNDLLDMCLDAVRRGFVDQRRIGVTGGSYGGYMTLKLITKTDFFAAAVGQRVLANPGTSYGTGDVGWISAADPLPPHFSMLKYLQDRTRGSNASRVDNIRIPLLLLHGLRDYRCTFEQSEQIFIPLKQRHPEIPLRLVMFPCENHALTRTGNLKAQQRHLLEILDWFTKYLLSSDEAPAGGIPS